MSLIPALVIIVCLIAWPVSAEEDSPRRVVLIVVIILAALALGITATSE